MSVTNAASAKHPVTETESRSVLVAISNMRMPECVTQCLSIIIVFTAEAALQLCLLNQALTSYGRVLGCEDF